MLEETVSVFGQNHRPPRQRDAAVTRGHGPVTAGVGDA